MLSAAIYLLTHSLLLSLHLSGNTGSFPKPLSAKEEQEYVARMIGGEIEARNVLVEHNLRLVAHIVKKYYTQSDEQDDLISIGTIGLIKGISSYRPEKGTRLATYAARCVENAILSQMRLWFQINPPRAKKNQNGVFWHKFPRTSTSFVPLRTAV
ncbi:MAG: sigma-70 family RNA polymerase sigma factor [Hominicoprocola sp.]